MNQKLVDAEKALMAVLSEFPGGVTMDQILTGLKDHDEAELRAAVWTLMSRQEVRFQNGRLQKANLKRYRMMSSRHDIPTHQIDSFRADSINEDAAAKEKFQQISNDPSNAWDHLSLERVDVEEVSVPIESSSPRDREQRGCS